MLLRIFLTFIAAHGFVSAGWITDYAAAQKQAQEQGKDLLIAFTGSDWDAWSAKFLKETLDTDEFKVAASEHFVLVQIDFPIHEKMNEEEKAQREEIKARFGVKGYPTLVLADQSAVPYSYIKYQETDGNSFLEKLKRSQGIRVNRDMKLKEIQTLTGIKKAENISRFITSLKPEILSYYPDLINQLKKADPKDLTGHFQREKLLPTWKKEIEKLNLLFKQKKFPTIVTTVDAFIAKHKPTGRVLQEVLSPKLYAIGNMDDLAGAQKIADEIKAASPDSPASERVDKLMAQLKEILARKKAAKEAASKQTVPSSIARPTEEPQPANK